MISAKTGIGIKEVLEAIVTACPPRAATQRTAQGHAGRQLVRPYLGVIVLVRVIDGKLKKGDRVKHDGPAPLRRGPGRRVPPKQEMVDELGPGEIGFHDRLDQGSGRHPRRRHDHP
jgi:GTP-binding protein LepA